MVTVPKVVGQRADQAGVMLGQAGLVPRFVGTVGTQSRASVGKVASQSPGAGARVRRGSVVQVRTYVFAQPSPPAAPRPPRAQPPRVQVPPRPPAPQLPPAALRLPRALQEHVTRYRLQALHEAVRLRLREGQEAFAQKLEDPRGNPVSLAWDARGRPLNLEQLVRGRIQQVQKSRGNLGRLLHQQLGRLRADQEVEVRVVLRRDPGEEAGLARVAGAAGADLRGGDVTQKLAGQALQQFEARALGRLRTVRGRVLALSRGLQQQLSARRVRVLSASQLRPVLSVRLRVNQVRELAARQEVQHVYLPRVMEPQLDRSRDAVEMPSVWGLGFTGLGIRLGVVEGNSVDTRHAFLRTHLETQQNCVGDHVTHVAGIMASRGSTYRGMGYNGRIINGTKCSWNGSRLFEATDWAVDRGARVVNFSWGSDSSRRADGSARDADALVYYDRVTLVVAAGNEGCPKSGRAADRDWDVMSPGTAYNVITVGNYDDRNTPARGDDQMSTCSSYRDPLSAHGDRQKPEVAAPGKGIVSTVPGATANHTTTASKSGTSMAAPHVAGIVGTLMQRWPELRFHPESVKAILMASATNNIEGGSRLSDKDGAGGVNALRAHTNMHWWWWEGDWFGGDRKYRFSLGTLRRGEKARVALAWSTWPGFPAYGQMPSIDLDLRVYDPAGRRVASSASHDNTYEIVEFTPQTTGTYRAEIKVHRYGLYLPGTGGQYKFGAALVRNVRTE